MIVEDPYDIEEVIDYYNEKNGSTALPEEAFVKFRKHKEYKGVQLWVDKNDYYYVVTEQAEKGMFYGIVCFGRWAEYDDLHIDTIDNCFDVQDWRIAIDLIQEYIEESCPEEYEND